MEIEKTEELLKDSKLEKEYQELLKRSPKHVVEEIKAIENGERLPELYTDFIFKKAFDADMHKDRLTKLLHMIFGFSLNVVSSLKNEAVLTTIYSKKSILDILAKLDNNAVSNIEMQVVAQEFITKRVDVYCSDVILMQYSIHEGQKKKEFDFDDIEKTYVAVLMKESPKLFEDNDSYIATWLSTIADVNDVFVKAKMSGFKDMTDIENELKNMRLNKEEMVAMLGEKYEQAVRNSELNEAKRKGKAQGIEQGKAQIKELTRLLLRDNRKDELLKALDDDEFCTQLFKEYGIE